MTHVKIWAQSYYYYSYSNEATVANFENTGKIWIYCVDKVLLPDSKNTVQGK